MYVCMFVSSMLVLELSGWFLIAPQALKESVESLRARTESTQQLSQQDEHKHRDKIAVRQMK
jgi:hypothetical protein